MQLLADGGPWGHPHLRPCLQQVGHAQSLSGKFALEKKHSNLMIVMNSDYHNCLEGHKSLGLSLSLMLSLSLPFVSDM